MSPASLTLTRRRSPASPVPTRLAALAGCALMVIAVAPQALAKTPSGVRILAPVSGSLITRAAPVALVRLSGSGSARRSFQAYLDQTGVTGLFTRRGRLWRAVLPQRLLTAGPHYLTVQVRGAGAGGFAQNMFVVGDRSAKLVGAVALVKPVGLRATAGGLSATVQTQPGEIGRTSVTLNGRVVTDWQTARNGDIVLRLSPTDGLRFGSNELRIFGSNVDGAYAEVQRSVEVLRTSPLAAAGSDLGAVAGRRVVFNGGGSVPARRGGRLSYRWRVLSAPAGSRGTLQDGNSQQASMLASVPGIYRVELTVAERLDGRQVISNDVTEVAVSPAMTPQGLRVDIVPSSGIAMTAPDGSPTDYGWSWAHDASAGEAHLLVLDRTTLQEYRYTLPNDATIDAAIAKYLKAFLPVNNKESFLVMLTGPAGCCAASKILPRSGFSYVFQVDRGVGDIGSAGVSNVGLRAVLGRGGEPGELTGALQPSPDHGRGGEMSTVFSFVQTDVMPYDTNAPTAPKSGETVLVQSTGTAMVLDVPLGSTQSGKALWMYTRNDSKAQQWTLTDTAAGGGYVEVVSQTNHLCLDASAPGDSTVAPGAVVRQETCAPGQAGQLWKWDAVKGDGEVYTLSPEAAPDLVLTIAGPDEKKIQTGLTLERSTLASAQQWRFALPGATFLVGTRLYNVPPPDLHSQSAFVVLALDAAGNPLPGSPRKFTVIAGDPRSDAKEQEAMYEELSRDAGTPGTTVLVQSINSPDRTKDQSQRLWWPLIAGMIGRLGGSPQAFESLDGSGNYAFVGCAGCRDGAQSVFPVTHVLGDGRLSGLLLRDSQSRLSPLIATPGSESDTDLLSIAFGEPSAWPDSNTPADQAMLAYVAHALGLENEPDPGCAGLAPVRDAYCNQAIDWAVMQNELDKVDCNAAVHYGGQTIDSDTCSAVKTELKTEFGEIPPVRNLIDRLEAPLVTAAGASGADLSELTDTVNSQVKASPDVPVVVNGYEILTKLGGFAVNALSDEVPGLELGWTLINQSIAIAQTLSELTAPDGQPADGTSADLLRTTVADLGNQLQARYSDAVSNLDRVWRLLVTDPVKLATAAADAIGPWEELTTPTALQASAMIRAGTRQWLYPALLRTVYQLHYFWPCGATGSLPTGEKCVVPGIDPVQTYYCEWNAPIFQSSRYYPYHDRGEPKSATYREQEWRPGDDAHYETDWAIARGPVSPHSDWQDKFSVPPASLMDPLFEPANPTDPSSHGVGLYPAYFFQPSDWTVVDDTTQPNCQAAVAYPG